MQMTSVEHPGEQRLLIESLASGEGGALEDFIACHGQWVRGAVYSVLGASDDVDDVMQQVWLRLWQRREQLTEITNWRSWLYTMARNAAVDAGRATTRRRGLWQRVKTAWSPGHLVSRAADADLLAAEQRVLAMRAIDALEEKYRLVLVLRVWNHMSYREIAHIAGITPQAVETRLVRARRMLREKLMRGKRQ